MPPHFTQRELGFLPKVTLVNWDNFQGIIPYSSLWYFSYSSKADGQLTKLSQLLLFTIFQRHFSWLHNSEKHTTVTGICNLVHFLNELPSVHPWTAMSGKEHTFSENFLSGEWSKTGFWTRLGKWISRQWRRDLHVKIHKTPVFL